MRLVLLPLSVAALVALANHPSGRVPAEDAGVFFYAAQRLLDGGLPYRDVWDHKPPGVYFADAVGLLLGGRAGVWVLQLADLVLATLCGYRAMRLGFGARDSLSSGVLAAFVGTVAWLVALPRLFLEEGVQTSFVELFGLPLQLGALLLYVDRPLTGRRALVIGALGGTALLFKPTLGAIWIAMGLVQLAARRRDAAARAGLLALGALVPIGAAVLWAAANGVLGEMIDQAVTYNRAYSAFAPLSERLDAMVTGLRLTAPSGLAVIALGVWLYAVVQPRRPLPPLLAVAVVALPIEIVLAAAGRGYHYYFIAWLPAMAVLVAFAANEVVRRVPRRLRDAVLVAALALMCVQPTMLWWRLMFGHDDGRIRAAAAYVTASSRASDPVMVWGSHTEVLFLAGRLSPTRYVYQYAALSTHAYATPTKVDEIVADLERRRPALILDASRDSFVTPPLDRAGFRAWTSPEAQYAPLPEMERILAFVEANYERAGSEPATGWPVWRLKAP